MIARRSALALVLLLTPATATAQAAFPGQTWPAATPTALGISVAVLDSIAVEIGRGDYGSVTRMVVIRRGHLVYDRSWSWDFDRIYGDSARVRNPLNAHDPTGPYNYFNAWWHPSYQRGELHTLQSVTKTVTSVIIGAAVTRGDFPGTDTPVLRFFDTTRVKNIDDRKRRMTVRHLLTMTGGFDWNENLPYIDPANTGVAMEGSYDWVQYVIDRPMAREPGTVFNYSSGETQLLAHIFSRATGSDIEEYAAKHLFAPLGIERWFWKRTPAGLVDTEGGLYLEAKDLARIWYLWLRGGEWNGARVVSPDWVKQSVVPAVRADNRPGAQSYGFKWWLMPNPTDTTRFIWAGSGFGGQFPMAVPELDLVVVFNGWSILPGMSSLPRARVMERIVRGTR